MPLASCNCPSAGLYNMNKGVGTLDDRFLEKLRPPTAC